MRRFLRQTVTALLAVTCVTAHVDGFGNEIGIEGDVIAIASLGSVFLFQRRSKEFWERVERFDDLGRSPVAVKDGVVYVGDSEHEKVHVFARQTSTSCWAHDTIANGNEHTIFSFGNNLVAFEDRTLAVTAFGKSDRNGRGFVYEGRDDGNKFVRKQDLSMLPSDELGGVSIAASGNKLVIGGLANIYLFVKKEAGMWMQSDHVTHKSFVGMSRSIAMDTDTVVVSHAPPIYPFGQGGSVTIYNVAHGRFEKQQRIFSFIAKFFGLSVALSGNTLAIGGADENVYMHEREDSASRFVRRQKLTASTSTGRDLFGQHVALDGDVLLVGAYLKDGPGGGSAYVFSRKKDGKWSEDQELKGEDLTDFIGLEKRAKS